MLASNHTKKPIHDSLPMTHSQKIREDLGRMAMPIRRIATTSVSIDSSTCALTTPLRHTHLLHAYSPPHFESTPWHRLHASDRLRARCEMSAFVADLSPLRIQAAA